MNAFVFGIHHLLMDVQNIVLLNLNCFISFQYSVPPSIKKISLEMSWITTSKSKTFESKLTNNEKVESLQTQLELSQSCDDDTSSCTYVLQYSYCAIFCHLSCGIFTSRAPIKLCCVTPLSSSFDLLDATPN